MLLFLLLPTDHSSYNCDRFARILSAMDVQCNIFLKLSIVFVYLPLHSIYLHFSRINFWRWILLPCMILFHFFMSYSVAWLLIHLKHRWLLLFCALDLLREGSSNQRLAIQETYNKIKKTVFWLYELSMYHDFRFFPKSCKMWILTSILLNPFFSLHVSEIIIASADPSISDVFPLCRLGCGPYSPCFFVYDWLTHL